MEVAVSVSTLLIYSVSNPLSHHTRYSLISITIQMTLTIMQPGLESESNTPNLIPHTLL